MNIGDLKKLIADLPDDMEVVEQRHSDLGPMDSADWSVVDVVTICSGPQGWLMHASDAQQRYHGVPSEPRRVLFFRGN